MTMQFLRLSKKEDGEAVWFNLVRLEKIEKLWGDDGSRVEISGCCEDVLETPEQIFGLIEEANRVPSKVVFGLRQTPRPREETEVEPKEVAYSMPERHNILSAPFRISSTLRIRVPSDFTVEQAWDRVTQELQLQRSKEEENSGGVEQHSNVR